jgi:hypothetical protein
LGLPQLKKIKERWRSQRRSDRHVSD